MRVLVFEDNLLWSSRLVKSLRALGHDARLVDQAEWGPLESGTEVAILNLGSSTWDAPALVAGLRAAGVRVIGHAGHKEKDLLELGRRAGCDSIATNSEITFKLEAVLSRATTSP
ncbi:MAG: hypothetical protein SNJ76_09750 [Fimbriimonadaceae bacterium]